MDYLTKLLAIRDQLTAAMPFPTSDPARVSHLEAELNQAIERQIEALKIGSQIQ
jgi:hypothetical protein